MYTHIAQTLARDYTDMFYVNTETEEFIEYWRGDEIRTPMNAIIGLDTLALKNDSLDDETRRYLEKIGGSAKHLLALINDILDMSRIESGRMTLRREVFSFSVTLTVERMAVFEDQSTLRFCIRDTGIGMDKEYIPKIFDAFSQEDGERRTKYGSTGLGMAITKRIVDMMNGTILVESRKGEGTQFTVTVTLRNCDQKGTGQTDVIDPNALYVLVVNAFDEDVQRSLQAGMNAHLTKPVESEQLIRILGELIYQAEEDSV